MPVHSTFFFFQEKKKKKKAENLIAKFVKAAFPPNGQKITGVKKLKQKAGADMHKE